MNAPAATVAQAERVVIDGSTAFSALTPGDVREWIGQRGEAPYRAGQVLRWFYRGAAPSFEAMSNLPPALRDALTEAFAFSTLAPRQVRPADGGETQKYLFALPDSELLESVCMHYQRTARTAERTTLCLSTQVGCAVGCPFCATGLLGLRRNMGPAEIIDQVLAVQRDQMARKRRVSHLVFMGMGEPLHNIDATVAAAERLIDPAAVGLSARHVTVSTSGVVTGIEALGRTGLGVNLAVSLHAAVDSLRDQLVPLNRKWPIAKLLTAADEYAAITGRRVSYEYVMLRGVNDSPELAGALGSLLAGRLAHVNLIPYNAIPGDPYQPTPKPEIDRFRRLVKRHRIECTVRDTRGSDIDAACGQLRASALEQRRAPESRLEVRRQT